MPSTTRQNPIDCLIIGGGPAGLATANSLSRLLHTCIVFSNDNYRNALSKHMHGLPTWEHRDPADFRAAARADILANYKETVSFEDVEIARVTKLERDDGTSLFHAVDAEGNEWWGRKLVLATGVKDIMLDIEGYADCWGKSIFHCLFCHGYEERGSASAGVLAIDPVTSPEMIIHIARFANRLASKVTIYTNNVPSVTDSLQTFLSTLPPTSKTSRNITIESRAISKFTRTTPSSESAEVEVELSDGEKYIQGFIAHTPKFELNGNWVEQLGLELTEQGNIKVGVPFNETSVKGVFSGGDAGTMLKAATPALSAGLFVAGGVAAQLEAED